MEKKNQKNAKNRASFLPPPVPPLNKGTLNNTNQLKKTFLENKRV